MIEQIMGDREKANLRKKGCNLSDHKNKNEENIMVCVTRQQTCARLIRFGAMQGKKLSEKLIVAHAISENNTIMGSQDEALALDMLTNLSFEHSAEMFVFRTKDVFEGLANCARKNNVKYVIMGSSPSMADKVSKKMRTLLPACHIIVVDSEWAEENLQ